MFLTIENAGIFVCTLGLAAIVFRQAKLHKALLAASRQHLPAASKDTALHQDQLTKLASVNILLKWLDGSGTSSKDPLISDYVSKIQTNQIMAMLAFLSLGALILYVIGS
ncbi:MAG: hypothetical protein COT74_03645 [Bdellovibrionales bacterium CG10_big_fil_rev_8_21_14_0_10_45_34]|nr:MAG: hypothetical protein COT74_03645 [Bdellovibrionales bacterium CG10_big_fil_rev_8_21_14_0_10_45_34]